MKNKKNTHQVSWVDSRGFCHSVTADVDTANALNNALNYVVNDGMVQSETVLTAKPIVVRLVVL
jgi:hypothetical protein